MTTIPSLSNIFDDILADFMAEFDVTLNPLGLAFLTACAGVLAGIFWPVWLFIGNVQKNIWFDTADPDELIRWGFEILQRFPFQAQAGVYTVEVTGTVGGTISANVTLRADDTSSSPGALFQIDGGTHVLVSSPDTIAIKALAGGVANRLEFGDTLAFTSPIANVDPPATVTAEVTTPVDAESMEAYRAKIREKAWTQPGSWSAVDYRLVGIGIVGIGQVYAYADSGHTAEVNVYLQGTVPVASPGPSVSPAEIAAYTAALELVLPLDVWEVHYAACPIANIVVTIDMTGFTAFSTSEKALVELALTDFINAVHPFIAAADIVAERNDRIATYNLNSVISAAVPGRGFAGAAFTANGVPETNFEADNGIITFYQGPVTYI